MNEVFEVKEKSETKKIKLDETSITYKLTLEGIDSGIRMVLYSDDPMPFFPKDELSLEVVRQQQTLAEASE